jgi:hypothetical protein
VGLLSVGERLFAVIVQDSKILLQSQQTAKPFSPFSPIAIYRMRPSFLTRPSYRGTIVFVSQAKQINDIFGFTVFAFLPSSAFSLNGNGLEVSGSMPFSIG